MISYIVFVFPLLILNKQILVEIDQTINKKDKNYLRKITVAVAGSVAKLK